MTIAEFQENKKLMREAKKLSRNETFIEMIKACNTMHPINRKVRATGAAYEETAEYNRGLVDGASYILKVLRSTFTPLPKQQEVVETYEPEEHL